MSFGKWIQDYLNGFYNRAICWMVERTYLRTSTIWKMMRRIDEQVSQKEMDYYISEYKRWKK